MLLVASPVDPSQRYFDGHSGQEQTLVTIACSAHLNFVIVTGGILQVFPKLKYEVHNLDVDLINYGNLYTFLWFPFRIPFSCMAFHQLKIGETFARCHCRGSLL